MSTILIANREPTTVKSLTKLLRSNEFEVDAAASGKELKQKLEGRRPDLIIADVNLPAMNGAQVIELVRRVAGNVPLLMISGNGEESVEMLGEATDFVSPSSTKDLIRRVRRALAGAARSRRLEVPNRELHDPKNGRIDAEQVASFLDVPLAKLAPALGVKYAALHKTPSAPGLQEKLQPIKRTIDLVSRFTLSRSDARAWLNNPHPDLGGSTPMDSILEGQAGAVATLLDNAFAGIPS